MTISSRTPDGIPHRCPICGQSSTVEPSYPTNDSCCPRCGELLWWFRDRLRRDTGVAAESIFPETSFVNDLGADSLDTVELVMELEEEFDIEIPEEDLQKIQNVKDAIRYIEKRRRERGETS